MRHLRDPVQSSTWSAGLDAVEDFRKLRGKRFKKLAGFLSGDTLAFHMLLGCLILMGPRYMGAWIFRETQQKKRRTNSPPICDLTNVKWSPMHVVMQFYSAVLSPSNKWQSTLKRYVGDAAIWRHTSQHTVRRLVVHAAVHLHRRLRTLSINSLFG